MGTEILRPQDCLREPTILPRRKPYTSNRKNFIRPEKKSTTTKKNDFVIGQITILKRGESLDISSSSSSKSGGGGGGGGGGGSDLKQIQISVAEVLYAGSAFYLSPSPSSLPLPNFSKKKEELVAAAAIIDDSATKDLRRLLRLDY